MAKKISPIVFLFCIFISYSSISFAQSAVYFSTENGAYGYSYNNATETDAKNSAYKTCLDYGGKNPTLIASTAARGYGAIVLGTNSQGYRVIGAAIGYSNLIDAINAAITECEKNGGSSLKVANNWDDGN
jgi:hypothetical protein